MKAILSWIDDRSGLFAGVRRCLDAPLREKPSWARVFPGTILFTFVVQAITGLFLWMYYSPSAQTAWESVYYLQHEVTGGWLLRAVHHYSAQVMLVSIGLYLVQMIVTRAYRAPREFVFWVTLLMAVTCLALLLTGDLLAWDQNSYESTKVRVSFLNLLPGIGSGLFKLAAGGPSFGHLTLTRFVALHIGVFTAAFLVLLVLRAVVARRVEAAEAAEASKTVPLWPGQTFRNVVACALVLLVIVLLALRHGVSGEERGVELGAPADPAGTYPAARPEWAFLGLYAFSNQFSGENKILPIFVYPTLLAGIVFAMPLIGKWKAGHYFNVGFTTLVLLALIALSLQTVDHDLGNERHQRALAVGREDALRVRQLARRPEGIPAAGARILLRKDSKTQGRNLFEAHCASCHEYARTVEITLSARGGTLTLAETDALGFKAGDGTEDASVTVFGKVADVNAALDGLSFTPKAGQDGPTTVKITAECQSHSIDRDTLATARTVAIQVGTKKVASKQGNSGEKASQDAASNALTIAAPNSQKATDNKPLVFSNKAGNPISINDAEAWLRDFVTENPSAPNLFGYGSRRWVAGWLEPHSIAGPNYFGMTKFKRGDMVGNVKNLCEDEFFVEEDRPNIAVVLSAEAGLRGQRKQDSAAAKLIEENRVLPADYCTDCHKFYDEGQLGDGPDLTGYASRQWTIDIIGDPAQKRFYGESNDRMPAYRDADEPEKSLLRPEEIELIADWLRGDWYEPPKTR